MNQSSGQLIVEHHLEENRKIPPNPEFSSQALLQKFSDYEKLYQESIIDPDTFWLEHADMLDWIKKPTMACEYTWDTEQRRISHTWFKDGILNVTENCIDRHLEKKGNHTALLWQGEDKDEVRKISYQELYYEVCRAANALKKCGIQKGDRVCLYLPMVPELAIATLACARIGAIHSVVFGGFSAESLAQRINDADCTLLITSNGGIRGGKVIPFKEIADKAMESTPSIQTCLVLKRTGEECSMMPDRDRWWHDVVEGVSDECPPEPMDAEDPLFILYTSGSTGKPKGVVHTQAGYLLYAALTHKYVFDIQDKDVYWCTADIGWITGHSYIVYGPLANGTTTLLFEGVPTYPHAGRFWEIVQQHRVTKFYTAPTAIRSLIAHGSEWPARYDLSSLKLIGTVGEPINPETWIWYYETIGKKRCPLVDTWWQTETGGILITPLPGTHTLKPGSATRPFFGIEPVILKDDGTECGPEEGGSLCIKKPWPGIMRTTWGDHERFVENYFTRFKDVYFTGDSCRVDSDGDYWLMGRIDDVVNISGHRLGTAEVESALVGHSHIAEVAAVPVPHEIKGQGLYVYVVLVDDTEPSKEIEKEIIQHLREEIGPICTPEKIHFTPDLPKTRSGKIMRRILRKIAEGNADQLDDTTTLANPKIIDTLLSLTRE